MQPPSYQRIVQVATGGAHPSHEVILGCKGCRQSPVLVVRYFQVRIQESLEIAPSRNSPFGRRNASAGKGEKGGRRNYKSRPAGVARIVCQASIEHLRYHSKSSQFHIQAIHTITATAPSPPWPTNPPLFPALTTPTRISCL